MDFNTIYQVVEPYIGTGAVASGVVVVILIALKAISVITEIKTTFTSTENELLKAFKKALPESLYINIEALAKQELAKIKEEIVLIVDEKFLKQIKENTVLIQAIASALVSMRAIPDSAKEKITEVLEIEKPQTTESLKVDLIPIESETETQKSEKKIKQATIFVE